MFAFSVQPLQLKYSTLLRVRKAPHLGSEYDFSKHLEPPSFLLVYLQVNAPTSLVFLARARFLLTLDDACGRFGQENPRTLLWTLSTRTDRHWGPHSAA